MTQPFDSAAFLARIHSLYRADEASCLRPLKEQARLDAAIRDQATARATRWIDDIRLRHKPSVSVTDLLARFGLTSQEGLALMCLAEALLRIPDRTTADALIRDKLGAAHWDAALGKNAGWAMNVTGWALSLTDRFLQLDDPTNQSPGAVLGPLVSRLGQPVIREAIRSAIQWLSDQFVMGQTIHTALRRCQKAMAGGLRFSFDMLGEGARTATDAARYLTDYENAIDALGAFQTTHQFPRASGISVKLSALHPRYEMTHRDRVLHELVPIFVTLCARAKKNNLQITVDMEECDRLQLELEVLNAVVNHPTLADWDGFGLAIQAYDKRAPMVIEYMAECARVHHRRIHIRLVKGAYWDTEIKRAQERGWNDFPVYTRKPNTDVAYLACAKKLLSYADCVNPVFGTHNALTAAQIAELAGDQNKSRIEFQRLHGMGDELHALLKEEGFNCCVYAPVGVYDVLLGYLVRRILENGANSSFVHRVLDAKVPVADLVIDPVDLADSYPTASHPEIRRAADLFMPDRKNSAGIDLQDPFVTKPLLAEMSRHIVAPESSEEATAAAISEAFDAAHKAFPAWSQTPVGLRADCLDRLADLIESYHAELMAIITKEAGRTIGDAFGEVREAADFCRYYARRARVDLKPQNLPGPTGESNLLWYSGRGVFVAISPWNFPLAIFIGQIAAALVAGNAVVAKPAPQTPAIAVTVARLINQAGFAQDIFQLVPGGPETGRALIDHPSTAGVVFTGSTATARAINRTLAAKDGPIVPLIAETGGQNAMIVDSSALPEQVVDDVITSSFRSAGQRCSSVRILCLPNDTADRILAMLKGAILELQVGDPTLLSTDVGPVIDEAAKQKLEAHVERLRREAREVCTLELDSYAANGCFVAPQAWEIPSIKWLDGEIFGPILHVVRYQPDDIDRLITEINATGYGLTGGLHSRIDRTVHHVERHLHVGNFYVNRSTIGATVGVQPFGGSGLSGTGPKAGGPHYLFRFVQERVTTINTTASGGNISLLMAASS